MKTFPSTFVFVELFTEPTDSHAFLIIISRFCLFQETLQKSEYLNKSPHIR